MEQMMTPEFICKELNMNIDNVWNIYPYGSRVYGSHRENSDHDFIIVFKQSMLPSGAFKDNAVSNEDRTIQGTAYSRGGFIDAINNYQMPALEAISLGDDLIVKKKFNFKMNKFDQKEMAKSIISQASNSWHLADLGWKREGGTDRIRKGVWHALRMAAFGIQIKNHQKVIHFDECNRFLRDIYHDIEFKPSNYLGLRSFLFDKLKK